MREIKFRAWTKRDKCWCGAFAVHMSGLWRESPNNEWIDLSKQDEIVLMQYTGLKDRNGKEIYEGDILGNTYGHRSEVIWSESRAGYWIRRLNWERNGEDTWHILTFSAEIIGNIYEHPNLLQANQE